MQLLIFFGVASPTLLDFPQGYCSNSGYFKSSTRIPGGMVGCGHLHAWLAGQGLGLVGVVKKMTSLDGMDEGG